MPPSPEITRLISLLDDEDEAIAVSAMAELLYRDRELGSLPGELQESDNPLVRRRIHQLEAALTLRRRRRDFLTKLSASRLDFIDLLIDIHLQWFDNDSRLDLQRQYAGFQADFGKSVIGSLNDLAYVMQKFGFSAETETTLKPENYCIGSILSDKIGSGAVLCGICLAALGSPRNLRIVRAWGNFAISDGEQLMIPVDHWQVRGLPPLREVEFFEERALLKYASVTLFSCAVNSDSFRYVLTILQALTGRDDDSPLGCMPYPYHPEEATAGGEPPGNRL